MQDLLSVLFFVKKNKPNLAGEVPIYLRITYNGKRAEMSVMRLVELSRWNAKGNRIEGNSVEIRRMNRHLEILREKVYQAHAKLVALDEDITAMGIKNVFLGKDIRQKYILEVFQEHNDKMKTLIGKDYAFRTYQRYTTTRNHLEKFIQHKFQQKDYFLKKVDRAFIEDFIYYLKVERNCSHNSAIKYISYFKKIIRLSYANGWIAKDPFYNLKLKRKVIERGYLTKGELVKLMEKEFSISRLEQVKDVFLFCCFTGLAYSDVEKLRSTDIVIGIDGDRWIRIHRTKTKTLSNIPILPMAQEILDKYSDLSQPDKKLLPVFSNQRTNGYLKEIADLCGIQKKLTSHIARHTFATTITLSNGVPLESVSKMLGHQSVKTTQHYAKIVDHKLSSDMRQLKTKLRGESREGSRP